MTISGHPRSASRGGPWTGLSPSELRGDAAYCLPQRWCATCGGPTTYMHGKQQGFGVMHWDCARDEHGELATVTRQPERAPTNFAPQMALRPCGSRCRGCGAELLRPARYCGLCVLEMEAA